MNLRTEILDKFRIHTLSGEFNFDALFQHIVDVHVDSKFNPKLNSVWDLTTVDNVQEITLEQIKRIVAYVTWKRSKHGKIKTALVVSKNVDFGIAELYKKEMELSGMSEINVFKDLQLALNWIEFPKY